MRVRKFPKESYHALSDTRYQRNPGRRDGFQWNSHSFLCPSQVDGFERRSRDSNDSVLGVHESNHVVPAKLLNEDGVEVGQSRREIDILEMARYVEGRRKLKGAAKGFEMVRAPARVIALDEDAFSVVSEEWELSADGSDWEGSEFELVDDLNEDPDVKSAIQRQEDDDFLLARRLQEEEDARFAASYGLASQARGSAASNDMS
ncbi:hypothetical protein MIND_00827500 [Mycena indigotica]|uniref:Uncharacterized protein n=1 Tax=Mycena indigotica TaxID=2126181 RepID=A0A8H6VYG6_9AGAR|nr:uncharacterized protein MIND_00827500 [Mycena indigotica]KAF7298799.1 hypothetical protein MIND_00827500 [Mycena indigotica]